MAPVALFVFSLLTHLVVLHSFEPDKDCPLHPCNEMVGDISFPFRSMAHPRECGLLTVDCSQPSGPKIQLIDGGYWYELENISRSNIISIKLKDTRLQRHLDNKDDCNYEDFDDLRLPIPSPMSPILYTLSIDSTANLTLFKCHKPQQIRDPNFSCSNGSHNYYMSFNTSLPNPPPACLIAQLPIHLDPKNPMQTQYNLSALTAVFSLQVKVTQECSDCYYHQGGKCEEIKCIKGDKTWKWKLGLALGIAGGFILTVLVVTACGLRRKLSSNRFIFFPKKENQDRQAVEAFLMNNGPLQVKRYNYFDVKKVTNSFKEKLGQGGYGGVYKGKLTDGRLVAVKVLNKSKGNGEEFMNEVAAISRTSHVNIVSLLGFCFEGSERALIYEFMPNGSLEKFIFDANNPQKDVHLGWETLERISLGIAQGLEYLHRGCNTRILHFDIKPHNILLDENFSPKISDFGLAKICNRKESIVSMLGARGTAGYIAPEVFCRNFGGVSHKSDVYSYGMMLSEMVGGRRNIDAEAEDTSEIYFPHWIYRRIELDEELGLQSIMNEEDKARARKMIIVSLWCIQTDPSNRPAMREAIDMLEGSVDSLQIPPKPYLSSPPPNPLLADSSTTLVSVSLQ